jgi:hypothetical protein
VKKQTISPRNPGISDKIISVITKPCPAILKLHKQQSVFSYGISDSVSNVTLYKPDTKTGIQVTGKPGQTLLPPPFDTEVTVGIGHQVHHKFVVCGFNTPNAVVWFGSSNLSLGGEEQNGDNLIGE